MKCPACQRELPSDSRFCSGCGAPLGPRDRDGERRHLTVMFCDLVDSTEMAARLDAEEWRELVRRYHAAATEVVGRFGGHVEQYLGDGVLAYFGWPVAHDDDAERAVQSGLALLEAVARMNERPAATGGAALAVRVGVHSGQVVVAEAGGAFGDTPNIAARVQSAAEPGSVLISGATARLVSGFFIADPLGPRTLKGVAAPVALYRVRAPSGVRGRLGAAAVRGLTPFVGREEERRLLRARWEQVQEGDGQMLLVTGEPGIGKSRVVQALKEDLGAAPHTWIECVCSAFFENTPFRPVTEMLQQVFGWREGEPPERQVERLARALESAGLVADDALPLVAPLLGLALPAGAAAPPLEPAQERRKLLATLEAWIFGLARRQPVVLVVEDLHWVDPSTLELLGLLAEQGATAPLLLVVTGRPEFRAPWPLRAHHAQVTLNRLSRRHARAMVRQVSASAALPDEVVESVASRTDGVPLFVEELTRLVLEGDGAEASAAREIPTTLQASLTARLDRLGRAKEVAQLGAVIGREFSHGLLRVVAGLPEGELEAALDVLTDAELVHARGLPPEATYLFKHSLVQDAAYASLLRSRRRELHGLIARALTEWFPERAKREPELLAHHLTQAGEAAAAVDAWRRAGERARTRSAHAEALGHFTRGLAVLDTLPDAPERARQEIALLVPLVEELFIVRGIGAPESIDAAARARRLSEQLDDSPSLLLTLLVLSQSLCHRGELHAAMDLGATLVAMADRINMPSAAVWAHYARGEPSLHAGEPARARHHLQQAVRLYGEEKEHLYLVVNPCVVSLLHGGLAAWYLGLADTARAEVRAATEMAGRVARSYDVAVAEALAGILDLLLREPVREGALERLDALVDVCTQQHFEQILPHAAAQRGWALVQHGRAEEGIAALRSSLELALESAGHVTHSFYLGILANALALTGEHAEAEAVLDEALATCGEVQLERADHLRLRADLLARRGADDAEVEAAYRGALDLAARQGICSFGLRAATHFGRWLAQRGRGAEARSLVGPLCAGFSEGADTRDVRDARGLLDALAAEGLPSDAPAPPVASPRS